MIKKLLFRNLGLIIFVSLLFVGAGVYAVTIKFGKDSSDIEYVYAGQDYVTTSRDSRLFAPNSTGIETAITYVSGQDDAWVNIPIGVYYVTSQIDIDNRDDLEIRGGGRGTLLRFEAGGSNNWFVFDISGCNGITLKNLHIIDADPPSHVSGGEESHGVNIGNCQDVKILDCFFTAIGDESITITQNSSHIIVDNCVFSNYSSNTSTGSAISVDSGGFVTISNNVFTDNTQGIAINLETPDGYDTHNITVNNNLIENCDTDHSGILINSGSAYVNDTIISNNIITTNHTYGINNSGSTGVTRILIEGNNINSGIRLAAGTQHLINDNIIGGSVLLASANNVTLSDNYIYDATGRAIYFYNCDNGQAIGNKIINCGSGGSEIIEKSNACTGRFIAKDNIIQGSSSSSHGIVDFDLVDGNYIYDVGSRGIQIGVTDTEKLITNNYIESPGGYGISVFNDHVNITNNVIIDSNNRGIYVDATSDYTFISGNMISGGYRGIDIPAGATNTTCINNFITGASNAQITDAGDKTCIINNIGYMTIFPTVNMTTPQAGYSWFETSTNILYVYNGTSWVSSTFS